MKQDLQRITELELKAAAGDISPEEVRELREYLEQDPDRWQRFVDRTDPRKVKDKLELVHGWEAARERSMQRTLGEFTRRRLVRRMAWPRMMAAASVLLILATIIMYRVTRRRAAEPAAVAQVRDLQPGGNRATLRLGDGTVVALDSAGNGTIARQGATTVLKTQPGRISYMAGADQGGVALTNTITTPRGGQYQVTLADGTRVWLNAGSKLTFPTAFAGDKRAIEVSGEVFLQVAKDRGRPFEVKVGTARVTVLGTNFDVSDYADEPGAPVKATLMSGAVRVLDGKTDLLLKPGQQARLQQGVLSLLSQVDTEAVAAWTQGTFRFHKASIDEVMRQLARWYDIDVQFVGEKPKQTLTAVMSRNLPASEVLKSLELTGYHCTITDGHIEIRP
jgi:transmembrane sensor